MLPVVKFQLIGHSVNHEHTATIIHERHCLCGKPTAGHQIRFIANDTERESCITTSAVKMC